MDHNNSVSNLPKPTGSDINVVQGQGLLRIDLDSGSVDQNDWEYMAHDEIEDIGELTIITEALSEKLSASDRTKRYNRIMYDRFKAEFHSYLNSYGSRKYSDTGVFDAFIAYSVPKRTYIGTVVELLEDITKESQYFAPYRQLYEHPKITDGKTSTHTELYYDNGVEIRTLISIPCIDKSAKTQAYIALFSEYTLSKKPLCTMRDHVFYCVEKRSSFFFNPTIMYAIFKVYLRG